MNYKTQQAEMIYLALLQALRSQNISYDEKFEKLSDELLERHEAVQLLDLLDDLYDFISLNDSKKSPGNMKYVITLVSNEFAERGFCYACLIQGDEVTIYDDFSRSSLRELVVISIKQYRREFIEITKKDYEAYMLACCNDETHVIDKVRKKYLSKS